MAEEAGQGAGGEGAGEGAGKGAEAGAGKGAAATAGAEGAGKGKEGGDGGAQDFDWRSTIAGEDKKLAKRLERFTDLNAFGKSYFEADAKLNSGKLVAIPSDEDPDEVKAAWNKSRGIPETPDKYEIKVKPPEGLELSDSEKDRLAAITARLHKAGGLRADPSVVNLAHEIYYEERIEAEAQMEAAATIQKERAESALKKLWQGPEFKQNTTLADAAIKHFFGQEFSAIKDMQFVDGTRLGDHPEFVKAFAKIGRMTMEDPVFLEAGRNGSDPAKSLAKEKEEIMSLRSTNRAKYNSPETQRRLAEIYAAEARHAERQGAN